jgi:hypothetical protein
MAVKTGIGRNRIARSVIMLRGAVERYSVTISSHVADDGMGVSNAALIGLHWNVLRKVNAMPPRFTKTKVAIVIHLKSI